MYRWWLSRFCLDLFKFLVDEILEFSIDSVVGVFFIFLGGIVLVGIVCGFEYFVKVVKKVVKMVSYFYVKMKFFLLVFLYLFYLLV